MFATFSRQPARAHRLGHALSSMTGGEGYEVHHLVQGSAKVLGDVDLRGGTLVDVGGSHGFVSVDLARQHRRMRFIVQDLPRTIESAPNPVSEDGDATRRIEFTAHDFFTDQVVKGADGTLSPPLDLAQSLETIRRLKSLVPALKPGARIIVNEHRLSPFGEKNERDELQMRRMDALMLCLLNVQVRSEAEFRDLFRAADKRMAFKRATRPPGSRMSIFEAVWEP
ncbi:sterigmatocystin 8-O-methyltransferase [Gaeumannomyces tritici R3-111a-1]|uniref:Sterigmatocystin 8-O-methyltransferase n=1 Tax=Gaeumannomyces tritici (strain R3-111a-1) TaxID=644352 RepID=J3PDD2_GAET3|nr:sterigmatocystin 8-O-methyltransferase [Gaeumannomyces tritici R3-111a-1]EJT70477.1 sterigmatocystin 8-O-methyltransferase [Gaeumannomyces tritici R3-111a-1]